MVGVLILMMVNKVLGYVLDPERLDRERQKDQIKAMRERIGNHAKGIAARNLLVIRAHLADFRERLQASRARDPRQ